MIIDWKNITEILDRSQSFLLKNYDVSISFEEILLEKKQTPMQQKLLRQITALSRDILVTKNRIADFSKNHCRSGDLSKKWFSKRDEISELFTLTTNNIEYVCSNISKSISNLDSREDFC